MPRKKTEKTPAIKEELAKRARERDNKWRAKNKDHVKAYFNDYYAKHKAAISEKRKKRYNEDPEYKKACIARSKARNARIRADRAKGVSA